MSAVVSVPRWISAHLATYEVRYRVRYHRIARTALAAAKAEYAPATQYGKVVVVLAGDLPTLLVVPADARVDLALAARMLGVATLRIATALELTRCFPDLDVVAIPPLRHWPGVELWLDSHVGQAGPFLFSAGSYQASIEMDFDDLRRIEAPHVGDFLQLPLRAKEPTMPSHANETIAHESHRPLSTAERAYARYLARGSENGHDVEDWLSAERETDTERREQDQAALRDSPQSARAHHDRVHLR